MDLTKRLFEIQKQVDDAIPEQAKIEGQMKAEEERTKQQFGIKTISEMETELNNIGKEIDNQENSFKNDMQRLEEAHPWE